MSEAGYEIKGRCPGALVPMVSGDGLIARVKPRCGALATSALLGLAAASRYGNGVIELTRRANVQLRGVRQDTLAPLLDELGRLEMIDEDPAVEAVRNIMVGPLAGLDPDEAVDMRRIAAEIAERLAEDPPQLPAKFAFVLDGGGRFSLDAIRADVRLKGVAGGRVAVWLGGAPLTEVEPDGAARIAVELAHAYALSPLAADRVAAPATQSLPRLGLIGIGQRFVLGIGVPFGQLAGEQLRAVAMVLMAAGIDEVRLSPWRALYVATASPDKAWRLSRELSALGLMDRDDDPLARIDACPGAPACLSAHTAARADALRLAQAMTRFGQLGSVHVSGCAKGCARSVPADLTLIGQPGGGYSVIGGGTARDLPAAVVAADRIETALSSIHGARP